MPESLQEICNMLKERDNFLVVSHATPDGDAIGSQLGMACILKALNKNFRLYNISGIPATLSWINTGFEVFENLYELGEFKTDVCIFVDCGDSARAGQEIYGMLENRAFPASICIDHHRENPEFATLNWVDPTASSTAYMVAEIARNLKIPLEGPLGRFIYLGLVEDTGSFSYGNTDARTFALASEIAGLGLNVGQFNDCREHTWSMEKFRFWGKLSNEIQLAHGNTIAYVCVTQAMLEEAGLNVADLSDFASWMRRIKGTRVCALIRENGPGRIKISLRSSLNVNVQKVAVHFGGGGHMNAAAMEMSGTLKSAVDAVLPLLSKEIDLTENKTACS